jgi:hypothetical protein
MFPSGYRRRELSGGPLDGCTGYTGVFSRRTMSNINNGPQFGILPNHASNRVPAATGNAVATLYTQYVGGGVPCGSCGRSEWEGSCSRRADDGCWGATQRRCNIDWVNTSCMCPRLPNGLQWVGATVGGTGRENCGHNNSTCSWPSTLLRTLAGAGDLIQYAGAAKLPPPFTAGFINNLAERVNNLGGVDEALSDMAVFEREMRRVIDLARETNSAPIATAVRNLLIAYLHAHCFQLRRLLPEERRATDKDGVNIVYGTPFLTSPVCKLWRTTLDQPEGSSVMANALSMKEMIDSYCGSSSTASIPYWELDRLKAKRDAVSNLAVTSAPDVEAKRQLLATIMPKIERLEAAGEAAMLYHPVDGDVTPAMTAECDCARAGTKVSAESLRKVGVEDVTQPLPNFYRATRTSTEEVQIQADRLSREVIRRSYGLVSTPADRHCWFRPCDGTNVELVSDVYRNSLSCPSVICQANIVVDRTGGNVTIANNNFNIECTGSRDVPCPEGMRATENGCVGVAPDETPSSTAATAPSGTRSATETGGDDGGDDSGDVGKEAASKLAGLFAEGNRMLLIGGIVGTLLVIIIVGALIYFVFIRRSLAPRELAARAAAAARYGAARAAAAARSGAARAAAAATPPTSRPANPQARRQ